MINTTISNIWIVRLGNAWVGIEPRALKEVLEVISPTYVPLAPDALLGLVSNQGNIVPIFDLGPSLGLSCQSTQLAALVENQGRTLAFAIDEVVGLRTNLSGAWLTPNEGSVFSATLELEGKAVAVLNPIKLFEHLNTQMSFVSLQTPIETSALA